MTRDDIIRAAREAGFHFHDAGFAPTLHTVPLEYSEKCFERFAALVEAAATEKANELADEETEWARGYIEGIKDVAEGIRDRGAEKWA